MRRIFGKRSGLVGASVLVAGLLVGCGSGGETAKSGDVSTITVQTYPGLWINALVWVAQDQGIDKKNGLEIKTVDIATGPQGLAALQSGSIQLSQNSSDNLILAANKGMDVKVVVGSFGNLYTLMASSKLSLPNAYPANVQGLKGLKIGVTAPGASTDILARTTVKDAGLSEGSAEFVAAGGTAGQIAALDSGVVDAVVAMTPQDTVFKENGQAKSLVDYAAGEGPSTVKELGACFESYFGLSGWLDSHAAEAKAFRASLAEASAWADKPENFEALAKLLNSKAPLNNVDNPEAVAKTAVKSMLDRGLLSTDFEAACLSKWDNYLLKNGVLKQSIDTRKLMWSAK